MLRIGGGCPSWEDAKRELDPGHALGKPVILFKKLEAAELFAETKTPDGP